MMISKKVLRNLVCKIAFAGVLLASVSICAEVVDKVIVVVNDEVITQREFDRIFAPLRNKYEASFKGEELEKRLEAARQGMLEQVINSKLAVSLAKKGKLNVDEEELQGRLQKIQSYYSTREEFLKALSDRGTNLTELEQEMRDQMLAQKLIEKEVAGKIVITPSELQDLYEKNKENIKSPPRTKVRTIMIRKKEGSAEGQDRKSMEKIRKKVRKGTNFAKVAAASSEGPFAEKEGEVGYIVPGQLTAEIEEVVFALKKGEVSEIVETRIGYHIFMAEDVQEPRLLEFDEVSDFLRQELYKKKFEGELIKWLTEKRKNAYISYK